MDGKECRLTTQEKHLFEFLQKDLEMHTDRLSEAYEREDPKSFTQYGQWKELVLNLTRVSSKFFRHFVDGVMDKSLTSLEENAPAPATKRQRVVDTEMMQRRLANPLAAQEPPSVRAAAAAAPPPARASRSSAPHLRTAADFSVPPALVFPSFMSRHAVPPLRAAAASSSLPTRVPPGAQLVAPQLSAATLARVLSSSVPQSEPPAATSPLPAPVPPSGVPLPEPPDYSAQLEQLSAMGFGDESLTLPLLVAKSGSLEAVLAMLLIE
jgi:hypothetical protein